MRGREEEGGGEEAHSSNGQAGGETKFGVLAAALGNVS